MIVDFSENFNNHQLIIIPFTFFGHTANFLVDSGANMSLIGIKEFNELVLTDEEYQKEYAKYHAQTGIHTSDGEYYTEDIIALSYELDGEQHIGPFAITTTCALDKVEEDYGIRISGVLGSDFLSSHGIIIDYGACKLCSGIKMIWE